MKTTTTDLKAVRKDLNGIAQQQTNQLITDCKVFFAFSKDQFEKNKTELKEGEKYVSIGMGGYMPKSYVEQFREGNKRIAKEKTDAMRSAKAEQKESIILYELDNHEAFYTYELEDTINALHGVFSYEEVKAVFDKNKHRYD